MSPNFTFFQISVLNLSWSTRESLFQVEKFSFSRPLLTSLATNQANGATLPYQGQTVSLEWQSKQERRKRSITGWGPIARDSTGGFVRSTGMN